MKLAVFHVSNFIMQNEIEYKNSINFFEEKGFKVIRPIEEFKKFDKEIALPFEFNKVIKRDCVLALPSFCEKDTDYFLDKIDYKDISKTQTTFCGNSFVTPILNAISIKSKNPVFYGPNFITQFNLETKEELYIDLIQKLTSKEQLKYYKDENYLFHGSKIIKGILIGGEINSLIKFWNTKYSFKINQNSILFIDGIINNIDELTKILTFLDLNNVFKKVKAIIFCETILDDRVIFEMLIKKFKNINKANLVVGFSGMFSSKISIIKLNSEIKIDFKNKVIIQ
ncbi:S66 peptidase family protein [Spiroplasma taiwanense]|uniref:LD-carboxypeptidase C-terminal domain-containing protein n=1 Tax=Spiroplasma taiwanense CT-1 TaxID=1276220 RepID=S5LZK0_9MOLU|nr:hypothetical protein [Spiroplasma taiwanense]AGR41137.1 hypothetical protein STAIW_v1c04980 [Spiroplasma taiwanense CT-1]